MVSGIYDSMELFLGFVALITLALGGIGVMNIMLVSVAERTREIGVKQAVGATPATDPLRVLPRIDHPDPLQRPGWAWRWPGAFAAVVSRLPLPTLFAGLPVSATTALLAFGTLVLVGILAAIYPARRASLLVPVEALRYE